MMVNKLISFLLFRPFAKAVFFVSLFLSALILPYASQANSDQKTYIHNVSLIDINSGKKSIVDIVVENEKISKVLPVTSQSVKSLSQNQPHLKTIDASGLYAIPGLWDMHVHLANDAILNDRILSLFVVNGITSVREMGSTINDMLNLRKKSQSPKLISPKIWFAGSIIDGNPSAILSNLPTSHIPPIAVTADSPDEAIRLVDMLVDLKVNFIKTYVNLDPKVFATIIQRAHYHNLPVVGHIPDQVLMNDALNYGIDGIEHLSGLLSACVDNSEELIKEKRKFFQNNKDKKDGLELTLALYSKFFPVELAQQNPDQCSNLYKRFAQQGTWHTPTLGIRVSRPYEFYSNNTRQEAIRYLPSSIRTEWLQKLMEPSNEEAKQYANWALKAVGDMNTAGVNLLAGTDTPALNMIPGFSLHDELEALVLAGLSPLEALQTATMNPAMFFSLNDEGAIKENYYANIVLLKADPLEDISNTRNIDTVILRGKIINQDKLGQLLDKMRNN